MNKYISIYSKLLCLEDDYEMMSQLISCLKAIGFKGDIICCENGEIGLKKLEAYGYNYFDLIISDIMMPVLNGLDFVKKVRELNEKTPILMLTSINTKEVVLDCIYSGANDYVVKPVDENILAKKIVGVMHVK